MMMPSCHFSENFYIVKYKYKLLSIGIMSFTYIGIIAKNKLNYPTWRN